MLPKLILYNSVSVDGAIRDFDVDIALHYEVLGKIGVDALLVGSNTAKMGIELFSEYDSRESPADFNKPTIQPNDDRLIWVIADSRGILHGLLHMMCKSGYAKDIIFLVSKTTPQIFLDYLTKRQCDFIVAGEDYVNYHEALLELNRRYGIERIASDSGGILTSCLLREQLVDEVQLLVSPVIVGKNAVGLFRTLDRSVKLEFVSTQLIGENHLLLIYKVIKE